MSQGIRPLEAQLRQRISHTRTHYKNFLYKTAEKAKYYQEHLAELEKQHAALLTEGTK